MNQIQELINEIKSHLELESMEDVTLDNGGGGWGANILEIEAIGRTRPSTKSLSRYCAHGVF